MKTKSSTSWTTIIEPKGISLFSQLKEIFTYRHLIWMFIVRDFKTKYAQTILGPLWLLINPLLSAGVFTLIFGRIAHISTEGVPDYLFYFCGNIVWSYFSGCVTGVANTFIGNSHLMGKVYFPRMIAPLSHVFSRLFQFGIQYLFLLVLIFYCQFNGAKISLNWTVVFTPFFLLLFMLLALGTGMLLASITVKYRDLAVLISFGMQLWMYITPVVYPVSQLPVAMQKIILLNPVSSLMEAFRYAYLGGGNISIFYLGISTIIIGIIFWLGIFVFLRVQRTFMDKI